MKYSQEGLAELMEVSKNTIHDIETGKKFSRLPSLVRLANVFNIDVYELLMPRNAAKVNSTGILIRYANEVKESVVSMTDDFIRKNSST